MTEPERKVQPISFEARNPSARPTQGRRTLSRRAILLSALGLSVALILLFLLKARALSVITPDTDNRAVTISGGVAIPVGERFLLLQGEYTLKVDAPGFFPVERDIVVAEPESQSITVPLTSLPGKVTFLTTPETAQIRVNGQSIVDQITELAPGDYTALVSEPRYQDAEIPFSVKGKGIRETIAFELIPNWAAVEINSEPEGAEIFIDGNLAGTTPSVIDLLAGTREIQLRKTAYEDHTMTIEVEPLESQALAPVTLRPAAGVLTLESVPSQATVLVNDTYRGLTPLTLSLAPTQTHDIVISKPGFEPLSLAKRLEPGTTDKQTVQLSNSSGLVRFQITPQEAQLLINGKLVGTGPQRLALPELAQTVLVTLEGYETFETEITPRKGLEQTIQIALLTEAEARAARMPQQYRSRIGVEMQLIDPRDAGTFTTGSSRRDSGRRANEVEQKVTLERAIYVAKTETTNAQFRLFAAAHSSGAVQGNSLNRDTQPAVGVSWQQAAQFCNWLSRQEDLSPFYLEEEGIVVGFDPNSLGYRLPTEAEWEFMTRWRPTGMRRFLWGDTFPPADRTENFADASSAYVTGRIVADYQDGHIVSAPVASFAPGPYGIFDLAGNVAEWSHDVYVIPTPSQETLVNPMGDQTGDNYVIKGASWSLSKLAELRLSYRDYGARGRDDLGFRIARYAE